MIQPTTLKITPEILGFIAELDEFKGAWRALGTLAPERLSALRRVATIESIGSSTRIEGSKLSDREVEKLLSNLEIKSFHTRDEQEVAGYAETMELIFQSWEEITLTENHVKQLHRDLLKYSEKDAHHRGEYKTQSNSVAAFDETGKQIGIVFETATPFDTPRLMTEVVGWAREQLESRQRKRSPWLLLPRPCPGASAPRWPLRRKEPWGVSTKMMLTARWRHYGETPIFCRTRIFTPGCSSPRRRCWGC